MIDAVIGELRGLVTDWNDEVKHRRTITSVDPVADDTAFRAQQLKERLDAIESQTKTLTPSQFATLHHTTAQTVTAWCRQGKIPCTPNGRSYLIPLGTKPPRSRSTLGRKLKVRG